MGVYFKGSDLSSSALEFQPLSLPSFVLALADLAVEQVIVADGVLLINVCQ